MTFVITFQNRLRQPRKIRAIFLLLSHWWKRQRNQEVLWHWWPNLEEFCALFIQQKFRSEISETSRAQWNGTFRLHRPDSNHGVCKTRTLYLRMADADGKMRIEKCGWEKMLIVRGKNEKCGWCGETSFKRKFISLSTMLCTCIWSLKTMPVNKWVRSLVNSKSKGKNGYIWGPI